jgi:myo-inositol-1(or 4)-monophosphatase
MREIAIETARQAGALLREGLARPRDVELKSAYEAVTAIDRASEALVVGALRASFPSHAILSEEGGGVEQASEYWWIIDPLDGTNNYVHGFPFFCVSIGLLRGGAPILGVVYDPLRDELFVAEAGRGAWCNDEPIRVSATPALAAALLTTGFPYDFAGRDDNNAREFIRLQGRTQGVRRPGAAALDLAYVACGRSDGHWELSLKPWDVAAGLLLVAEAGGRATDWRGALADPWSGRLVATNGRIHDELLAELAAAGAAGAEG